MLDLRLLRTEPETVKAAVARRGEPTAPLDQVVVHDERRRAVVSEADELRAEVKRISAEVGAMHRDGRADEADDLRARSRELGARIDELAAEAGQFTLADVAQGIHDKLKSRHPHVFGTADSDLVEVDDADEVLVNWEAIKRDQKGRSSVMDGIPPGLPALLFADKVIHKARSVGVVPDVDTATVAGRLYDAVLAAQAAGLDAESELRTFANAVGEQIRAREISSL